MPRWVALLRGVNIGRRRLAMADLRAGLEAAGCTGVTTYLQSGNAVVGTPTAAGATAATIGPWLEDVIGAVAGFQVTVVVRSAAELSAVVAANPYREAGGTTLHVVFYLPVGGADGAAGTGGAAAAVMARIDPDAFGAERGTPAGDDLYLHLPGGMGRSTLAKAVDTAARRKPALIGTARNWNTVTELAALAAD